MMIEQRRALCQRSRHRRFTAAVLLSAGYLFALDASAQSAGQVASSPSPAAGATEEAGGIPEITVTARKREESTQNVPVSVSVITKAEIERYDVSTLEKVAATNPQFAIGRSPSGAGATLVLRGIGSNTTSIGLEQSVAVVVDDVYYGAGRTIDEGFFDLGSLEILKGPQALFFGKNATAGVVSIATADPTSTPEFIGRLGWEFESRQEIGEAIVSGPLSDTLSARLAVRASKMNRGYFSDLGAAANYPTTNFVDHVVTNHLAPATDPNAGLITEAYGRVTLKWTPIDHFTATLKGNVGKNDSNNPASNSVLYNCPKGVSALNPAIPCGHNFTTSGNNVPADIAATLPYAGNGNLGDLYRSYAVTANLEYKLPKVTLTSVTNYNYNRNIFIFAGDSVSVPSPAAVFATEWSPWRALSSEFRGLTTFDSPVNGMGGVYYQKTNREYLAYTASGGLENTAAPQPYQRYLANSKDSQTDGKTIAVYGQAIWTILPTLEATAGARFTHETKDSFFIEPYSSPTRVAQGVFLPNTRIAADQTFSNTSPEATLTYRMTPDVTFYVAYKTAYKSGGFSNSGILSKGNSVNDFAFGPEKAAGYEGGIKTLLFDRQLRLNVGAYHYKIKNLQIDFFNSPVFAFTTFNAGSATSKGIETEFEFAPRAFEGLNLHGSLNYNEAFYADFRNAPCYTGQTPVEGCTIPTPGARPQQNLAGTPTANAPLWTASLGTTYERPVSANLVASVSLDARYSDDYLATAFGNPNTRQSRYVTLDGTVHVGTANQHWDFAVIGKNLTNRFYAIGGTDAPATGSGTGTAAGVLADQIGFVANPRSVQFQVTGKF